MELGTGKKKEPSLGGINLSNVGNRVITCFMAVFGVSLLGYATGTPGDQPLEAELGSALFTLAWMLRK